MEINNLNLLEIFLLLSAHSNDNNLVGGCVRDSLLGKQPHDWDIVTSVPMDIIEEIFQDNGWKVDAVGKQFLVMNVSKNGERFEIANYRKEFGFTDGRRPDITEIGDINTDSARRDFTINSIYYNPMNGVYTDLNNGIKDVKKRLLRFVGDPEERIKEDHLRIWRLLRFKNKLGFDLEPKTEKAFRRYFVEYYLKQNPSRVLQEILKM